MPESVAPPGQRAGHRPRAGAETRDKAFLNVPYDRRYERLYLAFIAGLSAFGLAPRATIELAGSQRRLDRIVRLLRSCRYSFHDLSRVSLDRNPPATPRFNMPFELGLAVTTSRDRPHDWFVFEERRHRLMKSLSDLNGTDPHIHDGEPEGVLRAPPLRSSAPSTVTSVDRREWFDATCGPRASSRHALLTSS